MNSCPEGQMIEKVWWERSSEWAQAKKFDATMMQHFCPCYEYQSWSIIQEKSMLGVYIFLDISKLFSILNGDFRQVKYIHQVWSVSVYHLLKIFVEVKFTFLPPIVHFCTKLSIARKYWMFFHRMVDVNCSVWFCAQLLIV